jgi:hypothetical protein
VTTKNNNGQTQPPASPEPKAAKVAYVISAEVKGDFIEEVRKRLAENPALEIRVPTLEEVVAANYEPAVAEKIVAHEQFKADVLADLKGEAAEKTPAPEPEPEPEPQPQPQPNPYLHSEDVDALVEQGHLRVNAARMVAAREADKERQERLKSGQKFRFRVLSSIGYDGKDYEPGKTIVLTQAQADEMPWAVELLEEKKQK